MTVIEYEKPVTGAEGVIAVPANASGPVEFARPDQPGAALLASAAGAEELVDDQPVSDGDIIAALEARTRPLDRERIV
jgi:hypothetical protein